MSLHSEKPAAVPAAAGRHGAGGATAANGRLERAELARLGLLALQLALLLAAARGFRVQEDFGFLRLVPLIGVGFVANALAPARWRPPLFTLLSLAGIAVVLPFPASVVLIGLGLALLGVCHLPLAFALRVALLVVCGAVLAAGRAGWLPLGRLDVPTLVLPVLAAMFMFRLALYLYELRHENRPGSLWERLSYFFMLPNVCFLLFPVVDYRRFRSTYYDAPALAIYQKGLAWMVRGLLQLLAYRVVYQYFVPAAGQIHDLWSFGRFVLSSYLLYLHISGQFHFVVGILCLFGFNLPTTHHLYYLAPDFNSLWRRINIYWRDVMSKLVFYPTFAALGRGSMIGRLVGATASVFVATWLLHSYQAFWLRGDFPLAWRDVVFWGVLGVLVIANSLREIRGPAARPEAAVVPWRRALRGAAATLGTFAIVCVLWSLWSSSSVAEWLAYAATIRTAGAGDLVLLLALAAAIVGLGTAVRLAAARREGGVAAWDLAHSRPALYTTGVGVLLVGLLAAQTLGWLPRPADELLAELRQNRLNVRDRELADRGYYEGVVDAGSFASALWKGHLERPPGQEWAFIRDTEFVRFTGDLLEYELVPDFRGSWRDAPFSTNGAGLRDAEHPLVRPPGGRRVALLGASYEMGAGVGDEEIFPAVLERLLNERPREAGRSDETGLSWEVVNLSIGGYGLVQRAELLRRLAPRYQPDLVLLTLYTTEENRLLNHLTYLAADGIDVPRFLADLFARAGVAPGERRAAVRQKLQPHTEEVMRWALASIAAEAAARGAPLLAVTVPTAQDLEEDPTAVAASFASLRRLAAAAGMAVVDLGDVYGEHEGAALRLAPWDHHVNALGHRLLAGGLYDLLTGGLPGGLPAAATAEEEPTP